MDDDNDRRPPFHWGDFGALVLAGGFSLFGLYLIADMMIGGHPLAILFQKPKEEPVTPRPLTADEVRKLPFHAEPGEVVLSTNAPLPGMGGAAAFPDIKDWASLRITLSRGACLKGCAAYSVTIAGDGTVRYEGKACVAEIGERTGRIDKPAVAALLQRFRDAGYFSLGAAVGAPGLDGPIHDLSVTFDGASKAVRDSGGTTPKSVSALEDAVDKAAGSGRWVSGEPKNCAGKPIE